MAAPPPEPPSARASGRRGCALALELRQCSSLCLPHSSFPFSSVCVCVSLLGEVMEVGSVAFFRESDKRVALSLSLSLSLSIFRVFLSLFFVCVCLCVLLLVLCVEKAQERSERVL